MTYPQLAADPSIGRTPKTDYDELSGFLYPNHNLLLGSTQSISGLLVGIRLGQQQLL